MNQIGIPALGIAGGIVGLLIGIVVGAFFLHMAAGLASIPDRSLGKAFRTTLVAGIASVVASVLLGLLLPGIGSILAPLVGIAVGVIVTQRVYETSLPRALAAYLVSALLVVVVAFVLATCIGAGFMATR